MESSAHNRAGSTNGSPAASAATLAIVLALAAALEGCAVLVVGGAAGAGAATVAYTEGDLEAYLKADPRAVEKACVEAFDALELRKVSSAASALDAEIIGRTATDTRIVVKATLQESGESRISIRAGTFGDETMSRKIYDEICKHLPEATRKLEEELRAKQEPPRPAPEAPHMP